MSRRTNRTNADWETPADGSFRWEHVQVEVLMDIRDELRKLNKLLHCPNAVAIPRKLDKLDRRLAQHLPLKRGRGKA